MIRALTALLTVALPLLAAVPAHAADAAGLPSKAQWRADVRDAMHGSVAYLEEATDCWPEGATGSPTRAILRWLERLDGGRPATAAD